jgi:hypothetical protein
LDYYFDDKPAVLQTLIETSVNVYGKDHSYNKEVNVNQIQDWADLLLFLDKNKKEVQLKELTSFL